MSNSLPLDIIKPELIKVEINIIKLSTDIEDNTRKKLCDILDKLAQYKLSEEGLQAILKQILEAQRCETVTSKRILGIYNEIRINKTHFV
jgi:hypothetical protein